MNVSPPKNKRLFTTNEQGETFQFINREYTQGEKRKLKIGDEVIVHPVIGISQATKSYPCKIVVDEMRWANGSDENYKIEPKLEICLKRIRENKGWHGAVLNEYGFKRLEFVQRDYKNTILEMIGL